MELALGLIGDMEVGFAQIWTQRCDVRSRGTDERSNLEAQKILYEAGLGRPWLEEQRATVQTGKGMYEARYAGVSIFSEVKVYLRYLSARV